MTTVIAGVLENWHGTPFLLGIIDLTDGAAESSLPDSKATLSQVNAQFNLQTAGLAVGQRVV